MALFGPGVAEAAMADNTKAARLGGIAKACPAWNPARSVGGAGQARAAKQVCLLRGGRGTATGSGQALRVQLVHGPAFGVAATAAGRHHAATAAHAGTHRAVAHRGVVRHAGAVPSHTAASRLCIGGHDAKGQNDCGGGEDKGAEGHCRLF